MFAVAGYRGAVRAAILAHKEDGALALAAPLGAALAVSVLAAMSTGPTARGPTVLVQVPSMPSSVRRRGRDPTRALALAAGRVARGRGASVTTASVLRHLRPVTDQAGLGAEQRIDNLRGALGVPARWRSLVAGRAVVVVDDVLTTGASATEAARALAVAGAKVTGIAVVAATPPRGPQPVEGARE